MNEHMETQKALMGIKPKGVKTEAKTSVKDKDVEEVKAMTKHNYHVEAYIYVCKHILRNHKLKEAFEGVEKVAKYYGSTEPALMTVRNDLYDRMIRILKVKLSDEDFKQVHGSL